MYLLVFGLPSYLLRFEIGGIPMTVLEGMILILFFVWLFRVKDKRIKELVRDNRGWVALISLLLVAATASIFVGPELRAAAGIWKAYFIEPVLFLVVLASVIKKEDLNKLMQFLGWSVFLVSLVAIYQKITGDLIPNPFWAAEASRRVTGVFDYPNALALYLAPIVILLLGWLAAQSKMKKHLVLIYLLLFIAAPWAVLYFTKSKGALLGVFAGLVIYVIFSKAKRKYYIAGLMGVIILVGVAIGTNRLDIRGRGTVEGGDSISTRLEMWGETWQMLRERPLLGAGLSGYQEGVAEFHQKEYIEIYLYPHNLWLNFWSETGLLGLLAFLGLLAWFYNRGLRSPGEWQVGLMAAMGVIVVHGLVDVPYFKNDLAVLFWLLIGMMVILKHSKIREIKKNGV